jgi:hypothetical protein
MQRVLVLSLWAVVLISAQTITITPGQISVPMQGGRGGGPLQPARPLRPEDACTLEGRTVNSATGEPVKWANVTLQGGVVATAGGRGGTVGSYTTTSNGEGTFAMQNLPPGRYSIRAERSGFTATSVPMTTLTPGQRMTGLELKMQPQAVIAGRVLDEHGEPVTRATVMAMSYSYTPAGKQLSPRSSATTNDLGEYRAFGLPPGRYYIAATYRPNISMTPSSEDRSAAPPPEEAYATTYYPGTTDMQSAAQVVAAPGAVIDSINLQLAKSLAVRVRGSIANLPGTTNSTAMVNLTRTGDVASSAMGSMGAAAMQGQFEFRGVTSGRYTLSASASDGQKRLQGRQTVDVGSVNVENIIITLGTGFDLPGKVRVDGQTQVGVQRLSLMLQPAESGAGGLSSASGRVDAEGNFVLTGVWPGRYLLRVAAPSNLYVKSQRLGSEDVLVTPLDLTGGAGGALSIVLGVSTSEVSGTVTSEDGAPVTNATVVLIPESATRRELQQFYRTASTGPAGGYKFTGVSPGRYKLYAWEKIPGGAWMDPDVLKPVESKGRSVDIQETSRETVDLRALPAVE